MIFSNMLRLFIFTLKICVTDITTFFGYYFGREKITVFGGDVITQLCQAIALLSTELTLHCFNTHCMYVHFMVGFLDPVWENFVT